jgi:signal transduction histidine kinase
MRVTLLPREAAARVITGAVATLAWSAGLTIVVLAIPVLVETLVRKELASAIPLPLALLVLVVAGILVALRWMTPPVVVAYLVIASAATIVYEVTLIDADPALLQHELYLVNRPTLALVAIGVASSSAFGGIAWCVLGFATANATTLAVALLTGKEFRPGLGPAMVLLVAVVLYLTLFTIQARQRRRIPRFEELESATRRRAASADLAWRTTAVVHDTVLNDLTVVMNAPDVLDDRVRDRLLEDLATLEGGAWMRTTRAVAVPDESQAQIRNELARIASEFRWRGLTVNVTGVTSGVYIFDPVAGEALLGALRATFENVLRHSGASSANVELVYSDAEVTFMVSDEGAGFDPAAVDADRLGIRGSIVSRMEAAGGWARIWSAPGAGTTVLLGVPVTEVRDPGEPSRHQDADYAD